MSNNEVNHTNQISDEQLNQYRVDGTVLRVIRDAHERNDLKGIVVAWNDQTVIFRKRNRRVVKIPRTYQFMPLDQERPKI